MAEPRRTVDRRLSVLHLVKGLGPGGAEALLVELARARDRQSLDLTVAYVVPEKCHHVPTLTALGVEVVELGPRWISSLGSLLAELEPDVVHAHSPVLASAARVLVRRQPSRPLMVTTEHNRWPRHRRPTRWANRLTRRFDDWSLAVSADVASTMAGRRRHPVEVLVHGIDLDATRAVADRAAVRAELGVAEDQIVIGTVANFRPEKGHDVLLRAAARVTDPRLHFVVVGQGPLADEIESLRRDLRATDRVQLLGYRADARRVLSGFDVFTLASRHEGLPVALMEALALGLPTVATRVGGIPEAVTEGHEALLVPSDDPTALAAAYDRLAGDARLRRRLAAGARDRAAAFGIDRAAAALDAGYRARIGGSAAVMPPERSGTGTRDATPAGPRRSAA